MATNPGQEGGASTDTIPYDDSDESTAEGDAVSIVSGDLDTGDAGSGHELLGVRARGRDTENTPVAPVHVSGPIVAAVESSVSAGDDLNLGSSANGNAGVLVTSSGGPAHALSDAGGEWNGQSAPAGHAWVLL